MTLKACPHCGYRYNAPENQTCGKCKGWLGAAFGLLMAGLLIKVVRLDMERFSKGLLIGIVVAGVFFVYLIFLLIFSFLYSLLEPVLQPLVGRTFKH